MNKIAACESGQLGNQLQLEAEKKSEGIIRTSNFVPTLRYQNKYQAGEFWESLENFENVVRDKLAAL